MTSQANPPEPRPADDPPSDIAIYQSLSSYPFDADSDYLDGLAAILGHPSTPVTPEELSTNQDTILQARCFYFARKYNLPPIDPNAYSQWLASNSSGSLLPSNTDPTAVKATTAIANATTSDPSTGTSAAAPPTETQPPYPPSFAQIVDLITRNVPIPGIEDIPDTVLEHGSSKVDHTPRRKKPWESDADDNSTQSTSTTRITAAAGTVEGGVGVSDGGMAPESDATSATTNKANAATRDADTKTDMPDVNGHLTTGDGVVRILQPNAIPESGLLAKD